MFRSIRGVLIGEGSGGAASLTYNNELYCKYFIKTLKIPHKHSPGNTLYFQRNKPSKIII